VASTTPLTQSSDLEPLIAGILGAAVALAGLLLVFSGFLFGRASSFGAAIPNAITDRYKNVARVALVPFSASLIITIASMLYWIWPLQNVAYAIMAAFAVLAIGTGIYGAWATTIL
jgi:hypothetical protein